MNRRKFLGYIGCSCCSVIVHSCTTAPITERKQLKLIPEHKLNRQAAQIYERVIVFLINEPHQKLIYDEKRVFSDFEFFIIDIKKEHLFIIDDHLNIKGHKFVGKEIFNYLSRN